MHYKVKSPLKSPLWVPKCGVYGEYAVVKRKNHMVKMIVRRSYIEQCPPR